MTHFFVKVAWLLGSLGLALLVCGLLLVPQSRLFADTGNGGTATSCTYDCRCSPTAPYPGCDLPTYCPDGNSDCNILCNCAPDTLQKKCVCVPK
jgi:hypothetical protein